jgi:hypothetical protein
MQMAKFGTMPVGETAFMGDHDAFVNELLENTPNIYDDDVAAEAIVIKYLRDLEAMRDGLMTALLPVMIDHMR